MATHRPLPPSSAPRWAGQCPGSVAVEAAHPEAGKSAEALEGDAAHEVLATVLRGGSAPSVGSVASNGVVIDDEIIESVEVFTDDVLETHGSDALGKLHVEEYVDCATIHPDNGGTPDVWWSAAGMNGGYLFIADYKHGHRFVDAFENWQLIDYAAGLLATVPKLQKLPLESIQVIFTIGQPRSFHPLGPIRRWTTTAAALQPYFATLRAMAAEAMSPSPRTIVGPECRDCTGRHACQSLQNAADNVADIAGGVVTFELPPVALGVELRMLDRAEKLLAARLTGLREQALALRRKGVAIPFYELKQGEGRERWTVPVEEVQALGTLVGHDLTKPKPLTPSQVRKLGVDADVVALYSERPKGELKLVQVTDSTARKVFSI